MPGPNLVAAYTPSAIASSITTPSFSPAAGELIVVKCVVADFAQPLNAPADSASALTFTQRLHTDQQSLISDIWTAPVVTAPGPITITITDGSASALLKMAVERWTGAKLAASPVVDDENGSGGTPGGTITTTKASSVVTWLLGARGATPTAWITTSATPAVEAISNIPLDAYSHLYQPAPSAGAQSYGVSAPASGFTSWHISAMEIQAAPLIGSFLPFI